MAIWVNTNVASLTAQRQLGAAQGALSTVVQRLSSGLRINSARDDAAGLAISERFASQIRGVGQAVRNANDGLSFLQTAEGALQGVNASLQRIRELSVQAANASNNHSDRRAIQQEIAQLAAEIDRTGRTAEFNGQKVFDQTQGSLVGDERILAVYDGMTSAGSWLESSEALIRTYFGLQADGVELKVKFTGDSDGVGGWLAYVRVQGYDANGRGTGLTLQVDMADFTPPNMPDGGKAPMYNDRIIAHEMVHAVMARTTNWQDITTNHLWFAEGAAEFLHGADERVKGDLQGSTPAALVGAINGPTDASAFYSASYAAVGFMHEAIKAKGGEGIKDVMTYMSDHPGATLDVAIAAASSGAFTSASDVKSQFAADGAAYIAGLDLNNADTGGIGGADVDQGAVRDAKSSVPNAGMRSGKDATDGFRETYAEITDGGGALSFKVFQVGANAHQTIEVSTGSIGLDALGLRNTLDVTVSAAQAIVSADRALDHVNRMRASIGAQASRLESAIANLQNAGENMSASRSRVVDADFAVETASLARQQILQQAGNAMVVQANQMPQGVLALLRR